MKNIEKIIESQRNFFSSSKTLDYNFRISSLKRLKSCVNKYTKKIYEVLKKDLNKPTFEAFVGEIAFTLRETDFAIKHLKEWMKPRKVPTDLVNQPAKSYIRYYPYGVTLILSPWNYPIHLSLVPLIGAIAAGNTAILKPSEYSPYSSELIEDMISNCFDENYISVITGEKEIAEKLLNYKFDKIFYTGNSAVGKIVMKKAAEHLTPITLELGGKSPAIVLKEAKIKTAARRIVWGKFFNAGQTCVSVDYVAAEEAIYKKLTKYIVKYSKNIVKMKNLNDNYAKIINKRHFDRLINLIEQSKVIYSGGYNSENLFIYPTVVEANKDDAIMEEEIFGPILPILKFKNYKEIKTFIKSKPKPLAMYIFTENKKQKEIILNDIQSGGVTINDTLIHLSSNHLPFGGVGESGMGSYHGFYSFEEFSQKRAIIDRSTAIDIPLRYPPYSKSKLEVVKMVF